MSQKDLEKLVTRFDPTVLPALHAQHGDETAVVLPHALLEVMGFLKNSLGYDFLVDVTAVDYLGTRPRFQQVYQVRAVVDEGGSPLRFEIVYHLRSMSTGARLRIKAPVGEPTKGSPSVPSVVALWPAANWLEREVWDLYGIQFVGHPDLRRILLYEEFVGHPLRKDYPKEKRQPLTRREAWLPEQEGTS